MGNGDWHELIASIYERGLELSLDRDRLCFLAALYVVDRDEGRASFSLEELRDVYRSVSALTEPGAENPEKRATHAINDLHTQRLLARVDNAGMVRAGDYTLTTLATGIIEFYVEQEALSHQSLTVLTSQLASMLGKLETQAAHARSEEDWGEIAANLQHAFGDLVRGIQRRQQGMDAEQEAVRDTIGDLLEDEWSDALEHCEELLESTTDRLREINEVLIEDTIKLGNLLDAILARAEAADASNAVSAARKAIDAVDRVGAWGQGRLDSWSEYFQFVQRYLRSIVRLDPNRQITESLRDQLRAWPDERWHLVGSKAWRYRYLRELDDQVKTPRVRRPVDETRIGYDDGADDDKVDLEALVTDILTHGPGQTLSEIVHQVLVSVPPAQQFAAVGRIAHLVATARKVDPLPERGWVPLQDTIEIQDWLVREEDP